jgi:hypothetical protein
MVYIRNTATQITIESTHASSRSACPRRPTVRTTASTNLKHLPKHLTRSFSSPSPSLPFLYHYRPSVSFSEPLLVQDDHHGQNWTMVGMIVDLWSLSTENAKKFVAECCTFYENSDLPRINTSRSHGKRYSIQIFRV